MSRITISLLVALLWTSQAEAQTPPPADSIKRDTLRSGATFGVSTGQFVVPGGFSTALIGLQSTQLREKRIGSEIALFTIPAALQEGIVILVPRASAVSARRLGSGWFFSKLGGEFAFGMGQQGAGGGLFAVHAGMGALLPIDERLGIRLEAELHALVMAPTYPGIVLTLGINSLPGR